MFHKRINTPIIIIDDQILAIIVSKKSHIFILIIFKSFESSIFIILIIIKNFLSIIQSITKARYTAIVQFSSDVSVSQRVIARVSSQTALTSVHDRFGEEEKSLHAVY